MDNVKRSYQFGLYRDASETPDQLHRNVSRRFRSRLKCFTMVAVTAAVSTTLISIILYRFSDNKANSNTNDGSMIMSPNNRSSRNLKQDINIQTTINATGNEAVQPNLPNLTNGTIQVKDTDVNNSEPTTQPLNISDDVVVGRGEPAAESLQLQNPRPFIFEYSNSFPVPFQRNIRNMNMYPLLARYRSSAHVKNLEGLIKYITSKGGKSAGLQSDPTSSKSIQFSGVYTSPNERSDQISTSGTSSHRTYDQIPRASENVDDENHLKKTKNSDVLYSHMPDNPGDVNLLAERKFRFSPSLGDIRLNNHKYETIPSYTYYKPLPVDESRCYGYDCRNSGNNPYQNDINTIDPGSQRSNNKPFSVMLDVYPLEDKEEAIHIPNNMKLSVANKPNFIPPYLQYRPHNPDPNPVYYRPGPYFPSINNPYDMNSKSQEFSNVATTRKHIGREGTHMYRNNNDDNPMKMMVQLNLYPRKKINKMERSTNLELRAYSEMFISTDLPKLEPLKAVSMYDANQDVHMSYKNNENNTEFEIFNVTEFKPVTEKEIADKTNYKTYGQRDIPKVRIQKFNISDHTIINNNTRNDNYNQNSNKMKYDVFNNSNCSSVEGHNIDDMVDVGKMTAILSFPINIRDTQGESTDNHKQGVLYKNKH